MAMNTFTCRVLPVLLLLTGFLAGTTNSCVAQPPPPPPEPRCATAFMGEANGLYYYQTTNCLYSTGWGSSATEVTLPQDCVPNEPNSCSNPITPTLTHSPFGAVAKESEDNADPFPGLLGVLKTRLNELIAEPGNGREKRKARASRFLELVTWTETEYASAGTDLEKKNLRDKFTREGVLHRDHLLNAGYRIGLFYVINHDVVSSSSTGGQKTKLANTVPLELMNKPSWLWVSDTGIVKVNTASADEAPQFVFFRTARVTTITRRFYIGQQCETPDDPDAVLEAEFHDRSSRAHVIRTSSPPRLIAVTSVDALGLPFGQ